MSVERPLIDTPNDAWTYTNTILGLIPKGKNNSVSSEATTHEQDQPRIFKD